MSDLQVPAIRRAILPALLLGFLGLSLAVGILNPLWEALDEPEHFQYVKFVVEQHGLPRGDEALPSLVDRPANELFQPPLYYLLEAPFVLGIDLNTWSSWVRNPYFTWAGHPLRNGVAIHTLTEIWPYQGMVLGAHVMRAVSSLMGVATLTVVYFISRRVAGPSLALPATLISALTPAFVLSSASIDNDNAAILTSAAVLLLAVNLLWARRRLNLWFALLGLAMGTAMLAKVNTAALLPVGPTAAFMLFLRERALQQPLAGRHFAVRLLVLAGAFVLSCAWYFLRISATSGYLSHYAASFDHVIHEITPSYVWNVWQEIFQTYWGSFGWDVLQLPEWMYLCLGLMTWLAAIGCTVACAKAIATNPRMMRSVVMEPKRGALFILLVALLGSLSAVIVWHSLQLDDGATAHARFVLPSLASSSILLTIGLASLPRLIRRAGFAALVALELGVAVYSLYILPGAFGGVIPVYGDLVSAQVQHPMAVTFERAVQFSGWSPMTADPVRAGEVLRLQLFWQSAYQVPAYPLVLQDARPVDVRTLRILPPPDVLVRPDFDYSAFVRLRDNQGHVIHDQDHGPGAGVGLLPHTWEPGEIIPDDWSVAIPADVTPGTYQIELGLYDYRNQQPILTTSGQPFVTIGQQVIR